MHIYFLQTNNSLFKQQAQRPCTLFTAKQQFLRRQDEATTGYELNDCGYEKNAENKFLISYNSFIT